MRAAASIVKLLDATAVILRDEGAAAVSVQRVADVAGTSKALVHYHFSDKRALLAACATRLAAQLVAFDDRALSSSTPSSALADTWRALWDAEPLGARRAFIALAAGRGVLQSPATLATIARQRQESAEQLIERLERLLGARLPIPRASVASAYVALADGLSVGTPADRGLEARQAFDAFWLAMLSLDG